MPKQKPGMTPEEQSKRFVADAQRMIDDGSLSPTDAESGLNLAIRGSVTDTKKDPFGKSEG